MENILQKIFTHYLSDDNLNKKEKTIKNIPGINLYQTNKYFTKFTNTLVLFILIIIKQKYMMLYCYFISYL